MSTWTTPTTFANGALTAATMNTEVRNHLNFLKGALDLLTASTTADAGNAMRLGLTLSSDVATALTFTVLGEGTARFAVDASGKHAWGPGAGAQDITLQRHATLAAVEVTSSTNAGTLYVRTPATGTAQPIKVTTGSDPSTQYRISLGTDSAGEPEIRFRRSTSNEIALRSGSDGRLEFHPSTGTGATHSRIGSVLNDTSTDAHSFFVWASGDTQPRASLGQNGDGQPRLAFGPGGSTAPDTHLFRSGVGALETDNTFLRIVRGAVGNGALVGRVDGDGSDQFLIYARGHASFLDGVSTKVKAGIPVDGDFRDVPGSGTLAVDTTNNRLYVRVGSTWRYAALT